MGGIFMTLADFYFNLPKYRDFPVCQSLYIKGEEDDVY